MTLKPDDFLLESQPRTVVITDIPRAATASIISSLVYGGAIERVNFKSGDSKAFVTFTTGQAAKCYFERTANGVFYDKLPLRFLVDVDIAKNDEPVSSRLRTQLECGATRIVLIKSCPHEYTKAALKKIASDKKRALEDVLDFTQVTPRQVVFRFMNIDSAVMFLSTMKKDEDFMDAEIMFAADPCEKAIGPHYD